MGKRENNLIVRWKRKLITSIIVRRGHKMLRRLDDDSKRAVDISKEVLFEMLAESKDTEYGRKYGFGEISSVEEYQRRVPLSSYDDYEPYIRRMIENGEENLISARPVRHYALSSGSVGVPKHIPVSQQELDKYNGYGTQLAFAVMDEYYRNTTGHGLPTGRGLNAIELKMMETENRVPKGAISATLMRPLQKIIPEFLTSPWSVICPEQDMNMKYLKVRFALEESDLTFMVSAFMTGMVDLMDYLKSNWEILVDDVEKGRINEIAEVPAELKAELERLLAPNPERARRLRAAFEEGFDTPIVPRIWPKVSWVGAIGTGGFHTHMKKMRRYAGKNIPFNNLAYAASESMMAVARRPRDKSYVLIPEGGFYEFIPAKLDEIPEHLLTIDELEEGELYEIVVTNLSGFYRYRIKDVIRVTGFYNEAPLIQFVYRQNQMISIQGEKTNEEAVRWSVTQFIKESGLIVNDYSVYADTSSEPGHYVFLMEPDHTVDPREIPRYRDIIEAKLMQANPSFGNKIRTGVLGPTELVFLQQETYQLYRDVMIMKGVSPNQLKPVRVIDTPIKEKFFFGLKEDY